jgi:Do/DeqQ family serine protease
MKQFVMLLLAAIAGSALTVGVIEWRQPAQNRVSIEHVATPTSQVAYRLNENGQAVPLDFAETAAKVTPAVVYIQSTSQGTASTRRIDPQDPFQFYFGPNSPIPQGPSRSSGSGVIINADGYIVTNNHVVEGADLVDVTLNDNRTFKAEVIGTDPDTDLAVIRIKEKGLPYLPFTNSDKTRVGEWVLAVGNPMNLTSTVTAGIISAKGRNIGIINNRSQDGGRTAIESFIQTDAAINPGNSGGALVNINGDLIGINTAIASTTGAYSGYGFAVPSNIVSKIVEDILAYGTVQRGWLGIQVASVTNATVKEFDLAVTEGAYVSGFAQDAPSAAKEAGIKEGDVVTKLDETPIKSSAALIEYIGTKRPGDKVNVTVDRKGKTLVIPVTLKNKDGKVTSVKREEKDAVESLGLVLEDIDDKLAKRLDIAAGVRVKDLENGKIARYSEMRKGFIITHIDDKPVKSVKEVNELLKKKKAGELISFAGVYEDFPREYIYTVRM